MVSSPSPLKKENQVTTVNPKVDDEAFAVKLSATDKEVEADEI
jgi:hypothetical protein